MTYNHLDLFSGIGGWRIALDLAGIPTDKVYYSEIEPYATAIYSRHYPQAQPLGDIRSIDAKALRAIPGQWIVTGSFPCQDISAAGRPNAKGINGSRSGLWYEMLRVINELQPRYVFAENSPALRKRGLQQVLSGLAQCGYNARWQNITASQFGAIHQRRRLWLYAWHADSNADYMPMQRAKEVRDLGDKPELNGKATSLLSWTDWERIKAEGTLYGEPLISRKDDGLCSKLYWTERIKALGNAIVPQVAAEIIRECTGQR